MFEHLFRTPETVERYQAAPLAADRLRYLRHCAESGAKRRSLGKVANAQLNLVRLLNLKDDEVVTLSQVERAAREWSQPGVHWYGRSASPQATTAFIGQAVRWLRFIDRLEEPDYVRHPYADEVSTYVAWMRDERGLSEESIAAYCRAVDEFFDWLVAKNIPLASVSITDIDQAIASKKARRNYTRSTIRLYAQRLGIFFRFAEERGWCALGMVDSILPARTYRDHRILERIRREDVQRLLATTEGDRPGDKRDRAILMLFIGYGLRAGEVCGLELDDLDWEKETLRVRRSKVGRTEIYPLSRGVGQAIVRYLVEVRPSRPERTLFFTLLAPYKPLHRTTMWSIVSKRVDRLGIAAERRGPHALRHATAQHLLDQGMSMKVIGDFLGHRSLLSTRVYATANLTTLGEVADFDLEGLA